MILAGLLSESSTQFASNDVEADIKAHYTPNTTGMQTILVESLEDTIRLEENVMLAEQIALAIKMRGDEEAYSQLSEGVVGDYFSKAVEALKRLWAKVKGWFANLFKSIETGTRDVTKLIEKYKKELHGKDYSGFEYTGHAWHSGAVDKFHSTMTGQVNKVEAEEIPAGMSKETLEKAIEESKEMNADYFYGILIGKQEEVSQAEAAKHIQELARGDQKKFKGFENESIDDMINFVKGFKDSKTIKKAESDTNKLFSKVVAAATKMANEAQKSANGMDNSDADKKKLAELRVTAMRMSIEESQKILSAYNSLTAVCVGLEKERFTEYKKVIASAIRHKG